MRAFKVVCTYFAKQAEVFSFVVGFYLVFIFQALTGISGSNIPNLLLVIFSAGLGYICYKGLSKFPVKRFELEEQQLGKLKGLDLFFIRLIIIVLLFILFYFNPASNGESEFLRSR